VDVARDPDRVAANLQQTRPSGPPGGHGERREALVGQVDLAELTRTTSQNMPAGAFLWKAPA
jgi:hypothetical protein